MTIIDRYSILACKYAQSLNHVQLFTTPWTVARQALLSMGFPRLEYWNGLPFPSPGDLPNSGIELTSLMAPALAGGFFTTVPPGMFRCSINCCCSVAKLCPTLGGPMDHRTPGFPVLHYLPEFSQTHVCGVSDTIHLSHLLSSPSPAAFNLSQHQAHFQ